MALGCSRSGCPLPIVSPPVDEAEKTCGQDEEPDSDQYSKGEDLVVIDRGAAWVLGHVENGDLLRVDSLAEGRAGDSERFLDGRVICGGELDI